jgi:hypothetical protein
VHRKRSQVAVVTRDGAVELNKNVVNGSEPMLRLIERIGGELHARAKADPRVKVLRALPGSGSSPRWSWWPGSVTSRGSQVPVSGPPGPG